MKGRTFPPPSLWSQICMLPDYSCCPITENTLIGWGFEHSDLVKDVPDHSRGLDKLIFKSTFQAKPFYDSVIYLHDRQYFLRTWI